MCLVNLRSIQILNLFFYGITDKTQIRQKWSFGKLLMKTYAIF